MNAAKNLPPGTISHEVSLNWTCHVARMEEGRSAFKILTGKPNRKETFGEA